MYLMSLDSSWYGGGWVMPTVFGLLLKHGHYPLHDPDRLYIMLYRHVGAAHCYLLGSSLLDV